MGSTTNHLAQEISPYLQQHAHNPVDWYPWGEEALQKAKIEDKPILLSIGYAACHWCHVMAHESFEDEATARLMNEFFINIKVDREERPDIDKIYQTAHYYLNQTSGGWPLTVFISPEDQVAFFSGTYFPRETRYQLPAFKDVLRMIIEVYKNQRNKIQLQNEELLKKLQYQAISKNVNQLNSQPIQSAIQTLGRNFDSVYGGFGHAPKFPPSSALNFLMQTSFFKQNKNYVLLTLQKMATGGIYDQLGGGFYRYSVDAKWQIPHFEKMLYDNAQLLSVYSRAAVQYQNSVFNEIVHATAAWIMKTMQSPEGGYYASIDADSEGHEGKYYIWDKTDIQSLLTEEEFQFVSLYYGLDNPPNFEGKWHLTISLSLELVAEHLRMTLLKAKKILKTANQKLLLFRNIRIPPARDEKILTAWNGLMIKGMLTAGHLLKEKNYITSANRALAFIYQNMFVNKRLLVSYKDGKAHLPAYLDDYAYLLDALIMSLQISWESEKLTFALQLADILLEYFYDAEEGGFFFTAHDHEKLLYRPKTFSDDVIPSGNAVAVRCFLTLGYLLGYTQYIDVAEKTLQASWNLLTNLPSSHCTLLLALEEFLKPPKIIILRGPEDEILKWQEKTNSLGSLNFAIPDNEKLPEALAMKKSIGKTCAYICEGTHCLPPIDNIEELLGRDRKGAN